MHLKIFVLVVSLYGLYAETVNVKTEKEGFCIATWITRNATYEPYTYIKRVKVSDYCGWRPCEREKSEIKTEKRLVYRDVNNTRVECCEGFEKHNIHGDYFDCKPICKPACEGGHCVAPGNCTCFHGYKHATANKCVPSCEPQCINGLCTSPGTCECEEGYYQVNGTYCAPNCSLPCKNGLCVKPNECLCNTGFEKNPMDPFSCTPMCSFGCVNSTCVNFNECACIEGHIKANPLQPHVCTPFCNLECINGECTAPDTCTCDEGFFLPNTSQNVCVPQCDCANGFCIEPNKCECFENYTLYENDCIPVCDNCINATCTSPYTCECLQGFKRLNDTVCTPHCSNCDNGMCTAPEECTCLPGYQNVTDNGENTCEPVCDSGCVNGICTAPNNCSCSLEIEKIDENICFPVCGNNTQYDSEYDCLATERTSITLPQSYTDKSSLLQLHLNVNCTSLYSDTNITCDFDSFDITNCTGINIECSPVKHNKEAFKFICLWKEINHYGHLSYEEYNEFYLDAVADVLYNENLNSSLNNKNKIATTILFPKNLTAEGGSCELCSFASHFRWNDKNKLSFQLFPCPPAEKEEFKYPGDYLKYVIIALLAVGILASLITLVYIFNKGKLHEYMVTSKYEKRFTNDVYDELMLTQESK